MNQITLAVAGKFHAFHLARQLAKRGRLADLYCLHRSVRPPADVSQKKFHNRLDLAAWQIAGSRIPGLGFSYRRANGIFDRWLAKKLRHSAPGVLHGWNGHIRHTFKTLEGSGWWRCVERSCPHNQFQYDLLTEEADRIGVPHEQDRDDLAMAIEELYMADAIICPSSYSANSYQDPALKAKLRCVALGGNFSYRPRVTKRDDSLKILMVGNAFLRKGTHYLIEAMKLIDAPNAELWIRGDVPPQYAARITDKRIKVIGSVMPDKLMELYQSADVFVQPSVDEGFGMTVLEALSFGLPLVVTEHVGAKDVLTPDVGFVVPIRSPALLAAAIVKAKALPGDRFDAERKGILERSTWSNTVDQMLKTSYVPGTNANGAHV